MTEFRVRLTASGREFTVDEDDTVLDAALREGVDLPFGCQSGGCAACRAHVVSGEFAYDYDPPGISAEESADGFALMCQARPLSDLEIDFDEHRNHRSVRVKSLPARVISRETLCHDVMQLSLKLPPRESFDYLPGQYVDVLLEAGERRSFSMASPASRDNIIDLHLRRVPGGKFTNWAFDAMEDRAMLRLEGPLGSFLLRDSDAPVVMVAGGTGLAPLKAMLQHALPRQTERAFHLYWGVRAERDLYMADLMTRWATQYGNFSFTPVLSEPTGGDDVGVEPWQGRTGWVHEAVLDDTERGNGLNGSEVYMSGPPVMIEAGRAAFETAGVDPDMIFYDAFEYAFATWPGRT